MKLLPIFSLLLIAIAPIATAKDMPLSKVGDPCWNTSGASKKAIISTGGIVLICKSNKFALATPQELVELNEDSQPKTMPHPEIFDVYKREAILVVAGQVLKDTSGCLYSVSYNGQSNKMSVIPIRDKHKRHVCE